MLKIHIIFSNKYGGMLEEILNMPEGAGCPNVFGYQMAQVRIHIMSKCCRFSGQHTLPVSVLASGVPAKEDQPAAGR